LTDGKICGTPYIACPPTALSATVASANQINLSWTLSPFAEAATTYKVYQGGTLIDTTAANATSYNVTGLTCNTGYAFTVVASNTGGDSSAVATSPATTTTSACSGGSGSTPVSAPLFDFNKPAVIYSEEIEVAK